MSFVELGDDLPMPQPLKTIMRGRDYSYIGRLPTHDPQLCTLAMAVIAEWSALDGAVLGLLTAMFPGRAEPIAEYYTSHRSDGPRTAMLTALAKSVMDQPELAVYEKLQKRYEASYGLRNPLAHSVLGHSPELPEAIIATDNRLHQKFLAAIDDDMTDLRAKMRGKERFTFDHSKVLSRSQTMLGESQVYREKDLIDIQKHIATTATNLLEFKFILNWKVSDSHPEKRRELFARLSQRLGLHQPMAT